MFEPHSGEEYSRDEGWSLYSFHFIFLTPVENIKMSLFHMSRLMQKCCCADETAVCQHSGPHALR